MQVQSCIQKCIYFLDISLQWVEHNCHQSPTNISFSHKPLHTTDPCPPVIYIWEGTVSDLIELAIALCKAELIRKPTGELLTYTEIVRALQQIFGVKIPNIYSRKTRAKERKKNASPMLDRMLALYKNEVEKMYQ